MVNKKTDVKTEFTMYNEETLKFMHKPLKNDETQSIAGYSMDKLEVEYDYETDEEQIYRAKKYLVGESRMSIEFVVKEDPLILVSNLRTTHPYWELQKIIMIYNEQIATFLGYVNTNFYFKMIIFSVQRMIMKFKNMFNKNL